MPEEKHSLAIEIKPTGIQEAARQLEKLEEAGGRAQRSTIATSDSIKRFGSVIAGSAIASAIGQIVLNTARANDALAKLADRTGESVENLSRLQYAASLNDVTNDQLAGSLQRLAKSMSETAAGSGESRAAFKAMGLSVTDTAGKLRSSGDVLLDIADRFSRYQDGAEKAALAQRIFGESGAALIPLLNQGRKGLADLADESDRLGQTIGSEAAKAAELFNDNLGRMNAILGGLRNEIGNATIPTLAKLSQQFLDARSAGLSFAEALVGIGLSDPTKSSAEHVGRLTAEIDKLREAQAQPWWQRSLFENLGGEKRIAQLEKELEYWRRQLVTGDQLDPRDRKAAAGQSLPSAPMLALAAPKLKGQRVPRAINDDPLGDFLRDIEAATAPAEQALSRFRDIQLDVATSSAELTRSEKTFFDLINAPAWESMGEPWKELARQQFATANSAERAASEEKRLNDLLAATPTAQLEAQRQTMLFLAKAFESGRITAEQFSEATSTALGNVSQGVKDASNVMEEFSKQAARNTQDAFADFLFNPFAKGLDGMLQGFGMMLQKMIAQAVAADLANRIMGQNKNGSGGLLDLAFSAASFATGFNSGTNFAPVVDRSFDGGGWTGNGPRMGGLDGRGGFLALMHPQETVIDHTRGQSVSNGANQTISIAVHVAPGTPAEVKRAAGAGAREALSAFQRAQRYT